MQASLGTSICTKWSWSSVASRPSKINLYLCPSSERLVCALAMSAWGSASLAKMGKCTAAVMANGQVLQTFSIISDKRC